MKIQRSQIKDGNILPLAWNTLCSVPEEHFHHLAHGKRHPKSSYINSLREIETSWNRVFLTLDQIKNEYKTTSDIKNYPEFLNQYRELLYRLNEHFDTCFSILRSLCLPHANKEIKLDSQFLDKAKLAGWKQFQDSIKEYREHHLGFIVNGLKHRQSQLCSLYFHSKDELRLGYYLQDLLPNGVLAPSPKLHNNGNTAFSISRDMMLHFWWVYRTGDLLSTAIEAALHATHQTQLVIEKNDTKEPVFTVLAQQCAQLLPAFFPDEVVKPFPRILYKQESPSLTIEFPSQSRAYRIVGTMGVRGGITIDGNHLSNKMPYWRTD